VGSETGKYHHVALVKSDSAAVRYWNHIGRTTTSFYSPLNQDATGKMRFVQPGAVVGTGSAATEHDDGGWHMLQSADQYSVPLGTAIVQKDGETRETLGTYTRLPFTGDYFTLNGRRLGAGPTIDVLDTGTMGYYAVMEGADLSQADMDSIWDAFNTGGGRVNTRVITAAIEALGGTVVYAVELNGQASGLHADPNGVGMPTYVDCTFEDADYMASEDLLFDGDEPAVTMINRFPIGGGDWVMTGGAKMTQSSLLAGGAQTLDHNNAYDPRLGMVALGGSPLPVGGEINLIFP